MEKENEYPLELAELVRTWLDLGGKLVCGSQNEDGLPRLYGDEAMSMAAAMVGFAVSPATIKTFQESYADPNRAIEIIDGLVNGAFARIDAGGLGAVEKQAAIYAKAFGVPAQS